MTKIPAPRPVSICFATDSVSASQSDPEGIDQEFGRFWPQVAASARGKRFCRGLLFLYLALILCPIEYWPVSADNSDHTWIFALNYAAAHHLAMGRDIVWTTGPLSFLVIPQDIGGNLAKGLAFQLGLWAIVLGILWDVFFRSGLPLRNLAFFTIFLGLSAPLDQAYGNSMGAEGILLTGGLVLLVQFQLLGGLARYVTALVMIGLVPAIKFVSAMIVAGIVVGIVVDRVVQKRNHAFREIALAVTIPAFVTTASCLLAVGSFSAFKAYLQASAELSSGYNSAMSLAGPPLEFVAAFEAVALLVLALLAIRNRMAVFFVLVLGIPFFVGFKHSFVRQDAHVIHIFCFTAFALGLTALAVSLEGKRVCAYFTVILLLFAILWQDYVLRTGFAIAVLPVTAGRPLSLLLPLPRFSHLRQMLGPEARPLPASLRIEPAIKAAIQHEPVASLSESYVNVFREGLSLELYPVLQRYSAYTPYLDQLNADWIRNKGPRFLLFDGASIDGRHPWTETPAMWVEIYRWYDTRLVGAQNLLLERRRQPRFSRFEPLAHSRVHFGDELKIPETSQPIFWTMRCALTQRGKFQALLFRIPQVQMRVQEGNGQTGTFRVVLGVLGSPSLGNYMPSTLAEFADVLRATGNPDFSVKNLSFGGPGASAYAPECEVEFLRPAL